MKRLAVGCWLLAIGRWTVRRWLSVLLVALAFAACSDRAPAERVGSTATGTAAASATAVATPPASTTPGPLPAALQQVLSDVATVRQLSPPPTLKAELVARSDLPALLEQLLTDEDRRWFANTTTLYRLLGHFRKDQDYLTVYQSFGSQSVLGLYSPLDKTLWIVHPDGASTDFSNLPRDEKETLAHELVHAVQDYHFNLDRVYRTVVNDLDLGQTWTSVVEGDAVTHEQQYGRQFAAVPGAGRALLLADPAQASDVPPSISRELFFPYTTGAEWVRDIVRKSGTQAIDAMLANPPPGTAFILHPDLLDSGWTPAKLTLPDLAPALGSGWKKESGGTWGEFGMRNYLQLRLRAVDAGSAAGGWAGDHYNVYVNGGQSVAAFRVRFHDAAAARRFAEAQQAFFKSAQATTSTEGAFTLAQGRDGNVTAVAPVTGDEVLFTIGSSKDSALRALEALIHG